NGYNDIANFTPVQNNISYNDEVGTTRGIHAEPWNKFISVATGKVFGAWVDLRAGETFGNVFTCEIDPSVAIFVPKGVGNSYQTVEVNTAYVYLVDAHWFADAKYKFLNLADKTANINWPISLENAILSDKDLAHPTIENVEPFEISSGTNIEQKQPSSATNLLAKNPQATAQKAVSTNGENILIVGSRGQLGSELLKTFPNATGVDFQELDITNKSAVDEFDTSKFDYIINAAAMTAVDKAETPEGNKLAWKLNVDGVKNLTAAAKKQDAIFFHISSDYVFDGTKTAHTEDEDFSPLSVYGVTKAAGDRVAETYNKHYILRTSWVIGRNPEANNFVKTMYNLAQKGVKPSVVDDQFGRLTFTSELARAIKHLIEFPLTEGKPGASETVPNEKSSDSKLLENEETLGSYGTYNISNSGDIKSWAEFAADVYESAGKDRQDVTPVNTDTYFKDAEFFAPRPTNSDFDLTKIIKTGFEPADYKTEFIEYIKSLSV
ncbi:MAG: bifunctional dTDP-4-dehydrorhamnose 3,5-epimerase family protein/NAD(P)-dependent oxidoreductase, partial [Bifidobacteriaceae bacterium]|nr:bifunctional dTDP-4-dehydrorhamnose 3,5-epimerase family protein/NAD(P)-dependent oxidoreductase [Bifidobacteriaceae bacterium]